MEEKVKRKRTAGYKYKEGVEYEGETFPSKVELWRKHGTTSLSNFRVRLHKGYSLEEALGVSKTDINDYTLA